MNVPIAITVWLVLFSVDSCNRLKDQGPEIVGGPCEGCEALYEYGDRFLSNTDTLKAFRNAFDKLILSGTVYDSNHNPAHGVILYVYHTNRDGLYHATVDTSTWSRRHGDLRGWVRTGKNGEYIFYTTLPGYYPSLEEPRHIHMTVKETHTIPYYIDSVVFNGDSLLTIDMIENQEERGGSGICELEYRDSVYSVVRDVYLGKNIPGY